MLSAGPVQRQLGRPQVPHQLVHGRLSPHLEPHPGGHAGAARGNVHDRELRRVGFELLGVLARAGLVPRAYRHVPRLAGEPRHVREDPVPALDSDGQDEDPGAHDIICRIF